MLILTERFKEEIIMEKIIKEKISAETDKRDLDALANELTYRKYIMGRVNLTKLFPDISTMDYLALRGISKLSERDGNRDKIYLQDIASDLKLPMCRVSEMIQLLKDKGIVIWTHDGDGSDGTYIKLTENGKNIMARQQEILGSYYKNVIEKFGREDFVEMLQMLARLEKIMDEEAKRLNRKED